MAQLRCNHCGATNVGEGDKVAQCWDCGKEVSSTSGAYTSEKLDLPRASEASLPPVGDTEKQKQAKAEASTILFAVGILQLVCGISAGALVPLLAGEAVAWDAIVAVVAAWLGLATVFGGLGWWALYQPLPASVLGLSLWLLLLLADIAVTIQQGGPPAMTGLAMRLFIAAALFKGVLAAIKAK
jgi:hypothetical protein